jgi:benzoylformate decarboxylase
VAFAEKLGAPVHGSALTDRVSFPENHPLYAGPLPMTIAEVNQVVHGHDLVIVIGAQVFRYYPYVAGEYCPKAPTCCRSPLTRTLPPSLRWVTA